MKRKIFSLFLVLAIVLSVVACNGNVVATSEPESESMSITPSSWPVATEEPSSYEVEEEDPYEIFSVSEEWAREFRGNYLIRGDKIYTLNKIIDSNKSRQFHLGWDTGHLEGAASVCVSFVVPDSPKLFDSQPRFVGRLTVGDIPTIVLTDGDKIVSFGNKKIKLSKASFSYSINAWDTKDGYMYLMTEENYDASRYDMIPSVDVDKFVVTDIDGNNIEDYRNLEYKRKYIASGFKGTDYVEKEMVADSGCFIIDRDEPIILDGELDKNGYAIYDFSEVPAGYYAIEIGEGQSNGYGFLKIE